MTVLVVVVALVVVVLTAWCLSRMRRLDRLHVRVDAARAGLGHALDHRARTALRVAAALGAGPGERLGGVARAALSGTAPAPDGRDAAGTRERREAAENALTRELAAVDPAGTDAGTGAALADAQQLVVLARRVHNDAVRDTRALRSRRLVRWLRLYGSAPEPVFFEIVDPEPAGPPVRPDVESRPSPNAT